MRLSSLLRQTAHERNGNNMATCYILDETTITFAESESANPDYVSVDSMLVGTGGIERPRLQSNFEPKIHPPVLHGEQAESVNSVAIPPAELLTSIRSALKLNMSDLASVLGVSRPTVYAWLDGETPSPENHRVITRLKGVADEVESIGIERIDKLLKRPIFGGASFLDKLKAQEATREQLQILKRLGDKEEAARRTRKGPGKSLSNEGLLEHSTPYYED